MVVPLGCIYTPLKVIENLPLLTYDPVMCKGTSCRSILNPYCRIDYKSKIWVCPFCFQRNHFPAHYNDINENNLPAELIPNYCTIEYALATRPPAGPPVFIFVVDTCMDEAELQALSDSIEQVAPPNLPPKMPLLGSQQGACSPSGRVAMSACLAPGQLSPSAACSRRIAGAPTAECGRAPLAGGPHHFWHGGADPRVGL